MSKSPILRSSEGWGFVFTVMKRALCLIGLVLSLVSRAQNLVPNPSFEDTLANPNWGGGFSTTVANWNNISPGTSDYFNDLNPLCLGCASIAHSPRTGNAYAGIYTYNTQGTNLREGICIQLSDTLRAGKKYCIEFYVSRYWQMIYACGNIGAYISVTPPSTSTGITGLVPQVYNDPAANHLIDAMNWISVSGSFIANGGEDWLTLANFTPDSSIDTTYVGGGATTDTATYYVIDDVSVYECDSVPPTAEDYYYIPNAFSPNGDGHNDSLFVRGTNISDVHLYIYNRWGEKVFEGDRITDGWDGRQRGEPCENAVYVYYAIITYTDGKTVTAQGNISLIQ